MSHAKPQPAHIRASGVPEGYDAQMILRELERAGSDETMVLHIARDDKRAESIAAALQFFAPDLTLLRFPGWDCLPYDRISPNAEISARRMATLARLVQGGVGPAVVLTTPKLICGDHCPSLTVLSAAPERMAAIASSNMD